MSAADLLIDGFPHGTPEGFRKGCRSNGGCPARAEHGISCVSANIRYNGDFLYRTRVDSGLSIVDILALDSAEADAARLTEVASRDAAREQARQERLAVKAASAKPKLASASKPAAVNAVRRSEPLEVVDDRKPVDEFDRAVAAWEAAREAKHAGVLAARQVVRSASKVLSETQARLQDAVRVFVEAEHALEVAEAVEVPRKPMKRKAAPAPKPARIPKPKPAPKVRQVLPHGTNAAYLRCRAAGAACGPCTEARRTYYRDYLAKRKSDGVPAEHHGTAYGYQLGCRSREACPAEVSCADASLAEERRRRREQGIPEAPELVDAAPVEVHVRQLMAGGVALVAIAELSGVSKTVLKNLLYGRSGDRRGVRSERISALNAKKVLDLPLEGRLPAREVLA